MKLTVTVAAGALAGLMALPGAATAQQSDSVSPQSGTGRIVSPETTTGRIASPDTTDGQIAAPSPDTAEAQIAAPEARQGQVSTHRARGNRKAPDAETVCARYARRQIVRPERPRIHEALNALCNTRVDLEEAARQFGGHRWSAAQAVDRAIAELDLALEYDRKHN